MPDELPLSQACQLYLDTRWEYILSLASQGEPPDALPANKELLKKLIRQSLTSSIRSYHYVLPTQVLCKIVDPSLNAHSLQKAWEHPASFDARTVAHAVIVPFDRANHRVLGGSPEPYVNNPLRCPAVTADYREQQKNKTDWDILTEVLSTLEEADDPEFVKQVFDQVLIEIYRLLAEVSVTYPVPNRVSLNATQTLLDTYLAVKSGGDRVEAVSTALFRTIGERFGLFDRVEREKVNVADASSGRLADIECWIDDKLVLLVEVKDRTLTLTHMDSKLERARAEGISEILFIAEDGKEPGEVANIDSRIQSEFVSGQNVYVTDFPKFSLGVFILLGEDGRVYFLREVGRELDRANSAISHRRAWADLLKTA